MQTPTSSHKRPRTNDDEAPEINKHYSSTAPMPSKRERRFEKKVMAIVNGDEAKGTYRSRRFLTIRQNTANLAEIPASFDDLITNTLDFFSPGHFMDAAAVLFNAKAITSNGWTSRAAQEYAPDIPIKVVNSYSLWSFKNQSQHVTTVEMYVCKSKGDASQNAITLFNQDSTVHIRRATGVNAQTNQTPTNPMWRLKDDPNKLNEFEFVRYVMKFDPGERCVQKIQGPFAYEFRPQQKFTAAATLVAPAVLTPSSKGCGLSVIIRVLNELQPVTGTTGANINTTPSTTALAYGPHSAISTTTPMGCIVCEVTTDIVVVAPEGTSITENDVMYNHSFSTALPSAPVYTGIDHDAPQATGQTDI